MPSSVFSEIDPAMYIQALQVIKDCDGTLPDDTYLEKMITTTVEKLRACRDSADRVSIYATWGLKDFVADVLKSVPPEASSPLHEFALKMLSGCTTVDNEIAEEAKTICERLLQGDELDLAPSSLLAVAPMLDLLSALQNVHLPPWSDSVRLWEKILFPLWKFGSPSERSLFWGKSFHNLNYIYLVGLVMWTVKQDATESATSNVAQALVVQNQLVQLSSSNDNVIRVIFPTLLRSLHANAGSLNPKEKALLKQLIQPMAALFGSDELQPDTAECQVLFWTLENSDKLVTNLKRAFTTWKDNETMIPVLKTLPFVQKRLRAKTLAPALEVLIGRMQHNGLNGEGFSNAYFIFKFLSKVMATEISVNTPFLDLAIQCVGTFGQEAGEYACMDDNVAEKTLDCLLGTLDDCLQQGLTNFNAEWKVLSGLCSSSHVKDQQKSRALDVMKNLLSRCSPKDSKLPLGTSFEAMWGVFGGPCHWGLQDSFLVLLGQAFKFWDVEDSATLVHCILLASLGSLNAFLRSTALETLSAMVPHAKLWKDFSGFFVDLLVRKCLVLEPEATVRRSCAEFVRQYFSPEYGRTASTSVKDSMTVAMLDLDCETKENALLFWKDLIASEISRHGEGHKDMLLKDLDANSITTALGIAMRDYDVSFLRKLCPIVNDVKNILMAEDDDNGTLEPVCKKPRLFDVKVNNCPQEEEETLGDMKSSDDVIMEIVNNTSDTEILAKLPTSNDVVIIRMETVPKLSIADFLLALSKFQVKPVTEHLDDFCELHIGLGSIVADIIQSVSDANAIDLIDCV